MSERRSWHRWAIAAAVVGIAGAAWQLGRDEPLNPAAEREVATAPTVAASPGIATPMIERPAIPVAPEPPPASGAAPADEPPPGLSREQWAAVTAEMQQRADGPAELDRLAHFLAWSETLRRFRSARQAGAGADEIAELARELDDGLPERLRHTEVSSAEARQIKSAVLDATVADESLRAELLKQWGATAFAPAAAADPRQAEFERRQTELVAAWSAQPGAGQDMAALQKNLEALRRQIHAGPGR